MSEPDHGNPWTKLSGRITYTNPWITVREDQVIRPDGQPGIYGVVEFQNRAIGILPVEDDGSLWLVGQYRYTLNVYSWEIPEGGCPTGEDPLHAASRELREETGLIAEQIEPLGGLLHLSNSVSNEAGWLFRATSLKPGPSEPEATERLHVRRVTWHDAWDMLTSGQITDSLSVTALLHEALRRSTIAPNSGSHVS